MRARTALALVLVAFPSAATAYDIPTHKGFALRATEIAERLHDSLVKDLDLPDGRASLLSNGPLTLRVAEWIREGAGEEDRPFWRVRHHFHNPLSPWPAAGLTLDTNLPVALGASSIVWGQRRFQEGPAGGGTWSWPFARQRFLAALTNAAPSERETAFADTFRALGHLTHFIQDATVPAHVRNDMHLWLPLGNDRFFPANSDWYEDWVEEMLDRSLDQQDPRFPGLLALPPKRPLRLVLHSEHPEAPMPIAGLIDTDQFAEGGAPPLLLGPHAFGVAEVTNANFLSRDTIFTFVVRPSLVDIGEPFVEARLDGTFRRYAPKITRGTPTVEISHFVAESALAHRLAAVPTAPPPSVLWILDDVVHERYARELIPRAIGYSAELLDYFFRGRLAVDLVPDPVDPSVVRVIGTNDSSEALHEGTLTLHADRLTGERGPATALEPTTVIGVGPGQPVVSARFRLPEDSERIVAVYQGTLGLERKADDFPGAVIGKMLGGVRVEEVFAQGGQWRLRTPRGVFDLPLTTATYDDVKWGDGDHVLVARTALDADVPFVDTFEIVRRTGSIDPVVAGAPPMVELRAIGSASLAFASAPLVTTVLFEQTTAYRQQIGRYTTLFGTQWTEPLNAYTALSLSRTPLAFETIHRQDATFSASIPIRLDTAHNRDIGSLDTPYYWLLLDVGADPDGRIIGLAAVVLTQPPVEPVSVPWFRLDERGQPFQAATLTLDARFPENMTIIWALVDLGTGEIFAATVEPTVRVVARHASEGPPWDTGGSASLQSPGIYRTAITTHSGGPLDGQVDEHVGPTSTTPRGLASGIEARLQARIAEQTLDVTGWFRPEIRTALARSGLASFDVGAVSSGIGRWNYLCVASLCTSSDEDYVGFEVEFAGGGVLNPPGELVDARRARPAPNGERLVLLADAFRTTFRPLGSVVSWDVATRVAREALAIPASFHDLGEHASANAVLVAFRPRPGTPGTFVVPLDAGVAPSFFAEADLLSDFTLVGGDHLYNVRDFRFYRTAPPLLATPLPARLSPLSPNPVGDYHAIRVP